MPQAVITLPIADESLWSNERRRRATLASMGIMPLISRADSAGAKLAERFLAPIPKDSGATKQEGEAAMGGEHVRALPRAARRVPGVHWRAARRGSGGGGGGRVKPCREKARGSQFRNWREACDWRWVCR